MVDSTTIARTDARGRYPRRQQQAKRRTGNEALSLKVLSSHQQHMCLGYAIKQPPNHNPNPLCYKYSAVGMKPYSFKYHLWLLLWGRSMGEYLKQRSHGSQKLKYLSSDSLWIGHAHPYFKAISQANRNNTVKTQIQTGLDCMTWKKQSKPFYISALKMFIVPQGVPWTLVCRHWSYFWQTHCLELLSNKASSLS